MANVATAQATIKVAFNGGAGFRVVTPVVCTFDTTGSDLTIYTPKSGYYAAIAGMIYQEGSAHTLTIKSGSTSLVTLERDAFDGIGMPLGVSGFIAVGAVGEALKLSCGTAAVSSLLAYCVEFQELFFTR